MSRPRQVRQKSQRSQRSHAAKRGGVGVHNHNSHPAHSSQPAARRGSDGEQQGAAMKVGWQTKKIGDVCRLMTGGTPSKAKPEYFGGETRWLVSGDIHPARPGVGGEEVERSLRDNLNSR